MRVNDAVDQERVDVVRARLASVRKGPLTVADGVEQVRLVYGSRTYYRNLKPHLALLQEALGDTLLTEVEMVDLQVVVEAVIEQALTRKGSKHGQAAGEHATHAFRALYRVCSNSVSGYDPTRDLPTLTRPDSNRTALSPDAVSALLACTSAVTDPLLTQLLKVFTLQSGARMMGVVNLRLEDLRNAPYVMLREKNRSIRRVPITDSLRQTLVEFACSRGAASWNDKVFRSRRGTPITDSYARELLVQLRKACHAQGYTEVDREFSHHWLRHTAVNNYVQVGGLAMAAHYAGHKITKVFGVTGVYTHVGDAQLISICAQLHGSTRHSGDTWWKTTSFAGQLGSRAAVQSEKPVRELLLGP